MSLLQQKLATKTDKQLLYYLQHPEKHTAEAIEIALSELQKRDVELTPELLEGIETNRQLNAIKKIENENSWTKNVVQDTEAPLFYSQRVIYIFSILCSPLFGAFLLAENIKGVRKPKWPVYLFGLLYTIISIIVLNQLSISSTYTMIANSLGVILMYEIFWKRYIGDETKYQAKPMWKPLIIALVIFIPYILILLADKG